MNSPLTSADMIDMLRRHYVPEGRPPAGVFAPEIGSPCGSRRADLIWLSTTIAGRRHMVGHEVKVSRTDVMVELRDPSKADPWAQYCDEWWLVVADPSLIDGLEIPEVWGIMAPPSGRRTRSMTVIRNAPKLQPIASADGAARVAAWLNQRHVALEFSCGREIDWRDRTIETLKHQIRTLKEGTNPRAISPAVQRAMNIIRIAEKEMSANRMWGRVSDEVIASAVADLEKVRNATRDLQRNLEGARNAIRRASKALDDLPEIDEPTLPFEESA